MASSPACRPTVGELKQRLRLDHPFDVTDIPMFPGPDNEDGPRITRIRNKDTGETVLIDLPPDDREATPSLVDHLCRRLNIEHDQLELDDGEGGSVSVRPPSEPPPLN